MNIFVLAYKQLQREGRAEDKNANMLLIDRAMKIRRWLDLSERNSKVAKRRYKK